MFSSTLVNEFVKKASKNYHLMQDIATKMVNDYVRKTDEVAKKQIDKMGHSIYANALFGAAGSFCSFAAIPLSADGQKLMEGFRNSFQAADRVANGFFDKDKTQYQQQGQMIREHFLVEARQVKSESDQSEQRQFDLLTRIQDKESKSYSH